jgi:capsid protein
MSQSALVARDRAHSIVSADRRAIAQTAQHDRVVAAKDQQLTALARVHEATRPTRQRKLAPDYGSGNAITGQDAKTLRDQARRLERDHDIARNALNVLEQNIVGSGIDVIPAPRLTGQPVETGLAQALRDLWDDWWDRPEVTWTHDFGKCQQLLARSWQRDGEGYFQALAGPLDRIGQVRGLSAFASVIARLEDIKDYEDSERIAAKVAASLSAQIIKGDPTQYGQGSSGDGLAGQAIVPAGEYRALTMRPGLIADDLLPGEHIELIDSKRPNPNTETFRTGQLRAAAGGIGVSYSSLARDYAGSYSSQRQELVEMWGSYQKLGEYFIAQVVRPIWREFVRAAVLSGQVRMPRGWTLRQLAAATYVRPVMPWIDPMKEAQARAFQEDRRWVAPQKNVLEMGSDPNDVLQQAAEWKANKDALGLTDPAAAPAAPQPAPVETP